MPLGDGCAVVIPCLNEAPTIGAVVRGVRAWVPLVWVVDDGSTDATAAVAEKSGAMVMRWAPSRGKGAAIRAGLAAAGERGCEWVLLMDGDGQHATEDIPALLAAADGSGAALIVGNRMGSAAAIPWLRRRVNRWMSRDLSRWTGVEIPDSQCGYRLIRTEAWNRVRPEGEGFVLESAMLVAFAAAGLGIGHVPVRVRPRDRGRSRIRALRDTLRWFRWRRQARRVFAPVARVSGSSGVSRVSGSPRVG